MYFRQYLEFPISRWIFFRLELYIPKKMNRKNFRHGNFHRKPKIQEKCSKCFKEIIYCLLHGCMINGHATDLVSQIVYSY